jgi:hypothetical protein
MSIVLAATTFTFIGRCYIGDILGATCLDPELVQPLVSGLLCTKAQFIGVALFSAISLHGVVEGNLHMNRNPCMRKNFMVLYFIATVLDKAQFDRGINLQKVHGRSFIAHLEKLLNKVFEA